jgi:hypothetical protein
MKKGRYLSVLKNTDHPFVLFAERPSGKTGRNSSRSLICHPISAGGSSHLLSARFTLPAMKTPMSLHLALGAFFLLRAACSSGPQGNSIMISVATLQGYPNDQPFAANE